MCKPTIALVGRPNVGKSTLFNRILGRNLAVVHDRPGITRDRIYADAKWNGRSFVIIDTGGLDLAPADDLIASVKSQIDIALREADAIILVVDVVEGITTWDIEVANALRKANKPVYLAVNKADNPKRAIDAVEFHSLGFGEPMPVSAIQGIGIDDLMTQVLTNLPEVDDEAEINRPIRIAVVGRPNVGKSSLVNAILGEERVIVDPKPGTTRDAINITFRRDGVDFEIVDTAGMRRRKKIFDDVERSSVGKAIQSIRQSDITWMVLDATQRPGQQDKEISSYIARQGKACIFIMNKWDILEKNHRTFDNLCKQIRQEMALLDYVPIISVSALQGLRIDRILELTQVIYAEYTMRIPTATLNKAFGYITSDYKPPMVSGKRPSPKYITQIDTNPPTFAVFTTYPELIKQPYERYLVNRLREFFGFQGAPIVVKFLPSRKKEQ